MRRNIDRALKEKKSIIRLRFVLPIATLVAAILSVVLGDYGALAATLGLGIPNNYSVFKTLTELGEVYSKAGKVLDGRLDEIEVAFALCGDDRSCLDEVAVKIREVMAELRRSAGNV